MIWADVSLRAKTPLVFVEDTMNAVVCTAMLDDTVMPYVEEYYLNGISGIDENVLGATQSGHEMYRELLELLSRALYDGGHQFDTVDDLCDALIYEWDKLDIGEFRKLVESMLRCVWQLYNKRGRAIDY